MTAERAIDILTKEPGRVGPYLVTGNDEYSVDFNRESIEAFNMAINALKQTTWIPVSEQLPKRSEYIGNVCKYYLVQDEYGDMHVAHYGNGVWKPIDSFKSLESNIVAWMPLPQPYKTESEG